MGTVPFMDLEGDFVPCKTMAYKDNEEQIALLVLRELDEWSRQRMGNIVPINDNIKSNAKNDNTVIYKEVNLRAWRVREGRERNAWKPNNGKISMSGMSL